MSNTHALSLCVLMLLGGVPSCRASDTTPPTVPTDLTAAAMSAWQINLSWTPSTDNVGTTGYKVYRNGAQIGTAAATSYPDIGLAPSTTYAYSVSAFDASGNNSDQPTSVSATTHDVSLSSGYPGLAADGKYIIDKKGQPFFVTGDAAWSLIAQLDDVDAVTYLSDRAQRGFNTIITNLLEHQFASRAPANSNGDLPFAGTAFQSPPNEAYFAHADYVLQQAEHRGITVLLFPAYAGFSCGSEGWCAEMQAATDAQMYAWGQYVGNRYKDYPSIIWVIGGDADPTAYPPLQSRLNQVALGIRASDPNHSLMTAHSERTESAMDIWAGSPWLTLNTEYGQPSTIAASSASNYSRPGALPLLMIEDWYENDHSMTALDLREEAYWAVLNGCTVGRVFGNAPLWALSYLSANWQDELGSTGSVQAALVGRLMRSREFWLMAPDLSHTVMTDGFGSGSTLAVTSRCSNGHTIVSYIPTQRSVTIDLTKVSGSSARAWWFDPSTGSAAAIGVFPTQGAGVFSTPDQNDWVLVVDDASLDLPAPGSSPVALCNYPLADANRDGNVDMVDFGVFQSCYAGDGDGVPAAPVYCRCLDADHSGTIDGADLLWFKSCLTGPGIPWVGTTSCPD